MPNPYRNFVFRVGADAKQLAVADHSDVRGIVCRPLGGHQQPWHELAEGRPVPLEMNGQPSLEMTRLDRTSGTFVGRVSRAKNAVDRLAPIKPYVSCEFNTSDGPSSDYYLHLPRQIRGGLMRWELRVYSTSGVAATVKGRVLRLEQVITAANAPDTFRAGEFDSNLDDDTLASFTISAATAESYGGAFSAAFDVLFLDLAGVGGGTVGRLTASVA